jgi:hypothetical protein
LKAAISDERRGVYFVAGSGTMLNLYERQHSTPESSVATFLVENLDDVTDLRNRSISFEEYDIPDLKTKGGVYSDETGFKVASFKDPDGKSSASSSYRASLCTLSAQPSIKRRRAASGRRVSGALAI